MGVPAGQSGQMLYDASGNLTSDTYSRADPTRTYDRESRLITNTDTSNQVSSYTYDSSGKRVRRNVNNQETWQVYNLGGELVAEYSANASPSSVQTEYGYRGGELLHARSQKCAKEGSYARPKRNKSNESLSAKVFLH